MSLLIYKIKKGFSLRIEEYTPKRSARLVELQEYPIYGVSPLVSFEEAKTQVADYNKKNHLEKKQRKLVAHKLAIKEVQSSIYLPPSLIQEFDQDLGLQYRRKPERLETIQQHWRSAQKLISTLNISPDQYYNSRYKIFEYYENQLWSLDYIKRITRVLNLWGQFNSRRTKTYYDPIPKLGIEAHSIVDHRDKNLPSRRRDSAVFQYVQLKNLKSTFENQKLTLQWNWMFCALWFGLRPSELDSLINPENFKVERDEANQIEVLHVYQNKLKAQTSKENRWKIIPVNEPEQKVALEIVLSKQFKRPLIKTLKRLFEIDTINTYSPRKSFTDLMLGLEYDLEDISVFLGHSDISTTWRHYKSKKIYKLPPKKTA